MIRGFPRTSYHHWQATDAETLFVEACQYNSVETARSSFRMGYSCRHQTFAGPPIYLASLLHSYQVVQFLIDQGADLNASFDSFTPLHVAAQSDDASLAQMLLEAGANPDEQDFVGFSPLHTAMERGSLNVLCLLIDFGANESLLTKFGHTAFDTANEAGQDEAIQTLHWCVSQRLKKQIASSIDVSKDTKSASKKRM